MATKKRISMKSVFYTVVSLVWIFGLFIEALSFEVDYIPGKD